VLQVHRRGALPDGATAATPRVGWLPMPRESLLCTHPSMLISSWMNTPLQLEHAVDSVSVTVLSPGVVLTRFVGRTTRALSEAGWLEFRALVERMERPVWVSDATRLTGFEARSLALGPRWFAAFRARGGRDCLVVSGWDTAIMAASTMALGLGVRIRNFRTLEEAKLAAASLVQNPAQHR
jgi:hypothetical protein